MDQSLEQWRPVVGYEGLYEVSNYGKVRSVDGLRWNGQALYRFRGKLLKPQGQPYRQVTLSTNGKLKTFKVHLLVAAAFLPPCPGEHGREVGCYHVDHINNDRLDNRAENLQWLTLRENVYTKNLQALAKRIGSEHPNAVLSERQVVEIKRSSEQNCVLSRRFNISESTIRDIKKGKTWKHVC